MNLTKEEQELLQGILIDGEEIGATISSPIQQKGTKIEQVLNIEPGSTDTTVGTAVVLKQIDPVVPEIYDDKDVEVDAMFQQIHDVALSAYADMMNEMGNIEPKFRARSGEVAATFLNTALAAATQKAAQKKNKDSIKAAASKPVAGAATTVIDVGSLIKQMAEMNGPPTKSLNRNNAAVIEDENDEPPARKMKTS